MMEESALSRKRGQVPFLTDIEDFSECIRIHNLSEYRLDMFANNFSVRFC